MSLRKCPVVFALLVTICLAPMIGTAQQSSLPVSDRVQAATESAVNQALTYLDSIATYLGKGVLYVLNLIAGEDPVTGQGRVSSTLQKPIGYLALITVILLVFGLLDFARRIIWIGIIVGWALLIVRVILDALNV